MHAVTTEGTAKLIFKDSQYPVAGKTGTAHVDDGKEPRRGDRAFRRSGDVPVAPADGERSDGAFEGVGVDFELRVVEREGERRPLVGERRAGLAERGAGRRGGPGAVPPGG